MRLLNQRWTSAWQDNIIPWLRYQQFWYPFYIFLIAFALFNFGKKAWWWIGGFIITVSASDLISSRLIKNSVQRIRPCRDPEVMDLILLRIPHCSGGYSFTSSHAANHFSMAMFLFLTLQPLIGKKAAWIFAWAGIIAYAQVYVGVHYPLDIFGGTLVGLFTGYITGTWFNRRHSLIPQLAA